MKHDTDPTDIGLNRTGIATSPADSKRLIEAATNGVGPALFDPVGFERERVSYSREATPVGTVPPPATLTGALKTMVKAVQGEKANVLLDALGERLAIERTATRLYEALLAKHAVSSPRPGGPTREELEEIRDDEMRHAAMVADAMERMGGDPTAVTPAADLAAVAGLGLVQVLSDPRTTLSQGLKTILIAELTDNDGWSMLLDLTEKMGMDDLAEELREAADNEAVHLAKVRTWVQLSVEGQAGVADELDAEEEAAPPPAE